MRRRQSAVGILGLAFGLASCSDVSPEHEGPEVLDSSGIQIVLSQSPAWGPGEGWEVTATPLVEIGVREGDPAYQFGRVWEVKRLPDGRFIVADEMVQEVGLFDPSGKHLMTIGGEGEGPGEFRAPQGPGAYRGDSIYVFDYALMRTSLFGPEGAFVRSVMNPPPGLYGLRGIFEDGSFFLVGGRMGRPQGPPGLSWISAPVLALSPEGDRADTLGLFPISQILLASDGRESMYHIRAEAKMGVSRNGFFYATSDKDEVPFFNRAGKLERIIRREREPEPVTEGLIERYKAGWLDYMAKEQGVEAATQFAPMLETAVYAEEVPFFGEVLVDQAGFLWVQDYSTPFLLNRTWAVFDPSGQWLGDVEMPLGLKVTDIGEDYVAGVTWDEVGVQHLQSYGLDRGDLKDSEPSVP